MLFDLVQVSQVLFSLSVGLWEPELGLDLIRHKWQSFSSIVLNSTGSWHVHVMANVVVIGHHSNRLNLNTYGCPVPFLLKAAPTL